MRRVGRGSKRCGCSRRRAMWHKMRGFCVAFSSHIMRRFFVYLLPKSFYATKCAVFASRFRRTKCAVFCLFVAKKLLLFVHAFLLVAYLSWNSFYQLSNSRRLVVYQLSISLYQLSISFLFVADQLSIRCLLVRISCRLVSSFCPTQSRLIATNTN